MRQLNTKEYNQNRHYRENLKFHINVNTFWAKAVFENINRLCETVRSKKLSLLKCIFTLRKSGILTHETFVEARLHKY